MSTTSSPVASLTRGNLLRGNTGHAICVDVTDAVKRRLKRIKGRIMDVDFLIAASMYLSILAVAVAWFLLPRRIFGAKAMMKQKARMERSAGQRPPELSTASSLAHAWHRARGLQGSKMR